MEKPVRPLRSILLFVIFVFVGGALLAPWLYFGAQQAADTSAFFQRLAANPFHRFVNRAFMILALVGLWPFLRSLGIRTWADAGLVRPMGQAQRVLAGFLIGFGSLAIVVLLAWAWGARHWNPQAAYTRPLLGAVASAGVVALLEEVLFRGAIFGGLRRVMYWPIALGLSSLIYALVHFFQRPLSPLAIRWDSGLQILPQMLHGFVELQTLIPGFLTLTLVGMLLGLAYQKTGNLYYSIGLHAGWIFWLKTGNFLTQPASGTAAWFWGTQKLIDGWLALLVLGVTGIFFLWRWRRWWFDSPIADHGPESRKMLA